MLTDSKRFEDLAQTILFAGLTLPHGEPPIGFKFRKGKTVQDIRVAVQRGLKNGKGKTEYEIQFTAIALKKVLLVNKAEEEK